MIICSATDGPTKDEDSKISPHSKNIFVAFKLNEKNISRLVQDYLLKSIHYAVANLTKYETITISPVGCNDTKTDKIALESMIDEAELQLERPHYNYYY
ncbi:unnamed protein product [Didymodactylos carnosus]|uniref:Uncharacterized protein n=1 Tax=Didymodactylos carnosus TaxID=1234261 RepID=A0A815W9J1_9BILA|nr:unnamed protein product [Didymodactylos carnosus]CAF1542392.1 unnamed protein product [Didymodactylos carnosus]CAF4149687.1 unnamed protein product [Didymodactylos carnosus]CAF4402849.1 unnamed protein product [Didymodactylos carnosus]